WAFRKPVSPKPPVRDSLKHAAKIRNPIDQFILKRLEDSDLEPAPEADRTTLARRAYFDLLGLPPSPEQVEAFVKDESPQAWTKLIDTLLASKHYGERWARHWLDVARYADSGGYETDIYYRNAWRYRDYVVKSFNDDKPYNVFLQEQIAGDELWPDNLDLDPRQVYIVSAEKRRHLEARIATGFYTLGPRVHESGLDAKRLDYETMIDRVDATASAFMGLTLGCARCHDHKFDPFTQADYFSLHAIFASAREVEVPLWTSMEEADWRQNYPKIVAVQEARKAYRLYEAKTKGKELSPEQQTRKQQLLTAIAQAVLSLPERAAGQAAVDYVGLMHIPVASVLGREHPALIKPVHVLERGELSKPLERRQPALPATLAKATGTPAELPTPFGSRKQLALWLTQPDHPLTARVMVNRIWQWHFGDGIVATANDFGRQGTGPSHPELLDWLARRFVESGWSVKAMHRLVMLSATYRQDSQHPELDIMAKRDPAVRYLWRAKVRRLAGDQLRDAMLAVAGDLANKTSGPSADGNSGCRSVFVKSIRNVQDEVLKSFDGPDMFSSCSKRYVSTTALQSLLLMNGKWANSRAQALGKRLQVEPGRAAQVRRAYTILFARLPHAGELAAALEFLREQREGGSDTGLTNLCHVLLNTNEFAYVD
ncbi:MAG: DUF1549 and DUF1553 domain-containing protein, partial [Roseibacillus sp.]